MLKLLRDEFLLLILLVLLLYPPMLLLTELGRAPLAALFVGLLFLLLARRVLLGVDWLLLMVFVLMFIDLGLLAGLPVFADTSTRLASLPGGIFSAGVLLSQMISNVPAAIFSPDLHFRLAIAGLGGQCRRFWSGHRLTGQPDRPAPCPPTPPLARIPSLVAARSAAGHRPGPDFTGCRLILNPEVITGRSSRGNGQPG